MTQPPLPPPPVNNFLEILSGYRSLVWPELEKYLLDLSCLPQYCQIPSRYGQILDYHFELVSDYPRRKGKYLRPSLLLLTAQAMGLIPDSALTAAVAMQLSEEWILIHDDVEDNSLERRGQPALHQLCGSELAINVGDSLHVVMWKAIFDAVSQNPQHSQRLFTEFYQLLNRTTLGQTIDIKWTRDNVLDLTQEDIFLIMESKTCYYTISGPMRLGAILAGATEAQLNHLYQFGIYLGRAFQVVDDLLDLTSDFSGLKKQQANDLYEGKRTVLLSHLWRSASVPDKKIITAIMSKSRSQKTPHEVDQMIGLMKKYATFDYAKNLAKDLGAQARVYFEKNLTFLSVEPFRSQIKQGIDFIVTRDH